MTSGAATGGETRPLAARREGGEVVVAIDAMGGDHGPAVMIGGAELALARHPDARFVFFGHEAEMAPALAARPALRARSTLRHTDVAVSAGNTGALMAMAKLCLRTMAAVERPAIAAIWPTLRGRSIVLDVGASIGADARTLVGLAVMGAAMARIVLGIERPSVGLLNVGTEEIKGVEEVKAASRLLREADLPALDYRGFVEGDDIGAGTVDVVVSEGFSGNIALKSAEGTAKQIRQYIREAFSASWRARLAYLVARGALDGLRAKMDVRNNNGGVFLGLNGIVIKSHGGMDEVGTAGAIVLGHAMVRNELLRRIGETLAVAPRIRGDAEGGVPGESRDEAPASQDAAETAARSETP